MYQDGGVLRIEVMKAYKETNDALDRWAADMEATQNPHIAGNLAEIAKVRVEEFEVRAPPPVTAQNRQIMPGTTDDGSVNFQIVTKNTTGS
jgi:hypothetical protein